ncbi:glucosyltransferase domain-containing protein [Proteus sp. MB838]
MISKNKNIFFMFIMASLIFYFPIINNGIYYRDDLHRNLTGYYGWDVLGRPLANYFSRIITSSGDFLIDIFPLNIIYSCVFLSISCLLIKTNILDKYEIKNSSIISLIFILNPFFIQNMMYRFDSIQMSFAILLSICSYTYKNKSLPLYVLFSIIFGVLSLSLYQPCYNIFLAMMSIDILCMALSKKSTKETFINIYKKSLIFIVSYLLYLIIIKYIFLISNSRGDLIEFDLDSIIILSKTFNDVLDLIFLIFIDDGSKIFFIILFSLSFICYSFILYKYKNRIGLLFLIFISIVIFFISLLGPAIFLKNPPIMARTIVTFPVLLMLISIPILSTNNLKYSIFIIIIPLLSMSYYISNAVSSQRDYESSFFDMINYDILNKIGSDYDKVIITGKPSYSRATSLIINNHKIVDMFVTPAFGFQASFMLTQKGVMRVEPAYGKDKIYNEFINKIKNDGVKPISCNNEYSIYYNDKIVAIKFGKC